jgi:hypothetical protein
MIRTALLTAILASACTLPALAGDPVPGVDVLLEQIPGGSIHAATTDANGNIIFEGLPPGQYRVFQDIERPTINVSGPAVFTPSEGEDIGMLTVTGRGPIQIDRIIARRLSAADVGRADAIPMSAEGLNSTRSNNGGIASPSDVTVEDAIPMSAEDFNTTRSNTGGITSPSDISVEDVIPMSAEDLNSSRSNNGNEIPVDEATLRDLLRNSELRVLVAPAGAADEESEAAGDNR